MAEPWSEWPLHNRILFIVAPMMVLISFLLATALDFPRVDTLVSLGSVSHDSAKIYIQAAPKDSSCSARQVTFTFRPAGQDDIPWTSVGMAALHGGPEAACSTVVNLTNLSPDTKYDFLGTMSDENPLYGSFTTFAAPGTPNIFSFSFSSCLGYFPLLPMYPLSWISPADLFLIMGDAIYADMPWSFGQSFEALYLRLVQDNHFRSLTKSVPIMAMYDDHEIRDNWDAKDAHPWPHAIGNWTKFLGARNPSSQSGGAHFTFQNGRVCVFVADVRRNRDASTKEIMGQEQLDHFAQWIKGDQSTGCSIKIFASPVTLAMMRGSDAVNEGWKQAPHEREMVLDALAQAGTDSAVLIISGDSHWAGVYQHPGGVMEIAASPLFQIPLSPFLTGSSIVGQVDFISTLSLHFARITVDTKAHSPHKLPSGTLQITIYASFLGLFPPSVAWTQSFHLSDLVPTTREGGDTLRSQGHNL